MSKTEIVKTDDLIVEQFKTGFLSHFGYMITSNKESVVIDPLRDTQVYEDLLEERGAKLVGVLNTHYHADFVSGYFYLAKKNNTKVYLGTGAKPEQGLVVAANDTLINLGNYKIRVLHTPGHTLESSCFVLEKDGKPSVIFTGDTLFLGEVGRPDLAQKCEITTKDLAGMLFESLKKLKALPDETIVLPGHGAGFSCVKSISKGNQCTLGVQKTANKPYSTECKEEFVNIVSSGLHAVPDYFIHNVALNKDPNLTGLNDLQTSSLKNLSVDEFAKIVDAKEAYVLDTRVGPDYDKGHVAGALHLPMRGKFAIWATYIFDFHDKVIVVSKDLAEFKTAVTRLSRTGLDIVIGYLEPGFEAWKAAGKDVETVNIFNFDKPEEFAAAVNGYTVVDIREAGEVLGKEVVDLENLKWNPFSALRKAVSGIEDKTIKLAVHCAGGWRSRVAYSFLKNRGFTNLLDLDDGYEGFVKKGVKAKTTPTVDGFNLV